MPQPLDIGSLVDAVISSVREDVATTKTAAAPEGLKTDLGLQIKAAADRVRTQTVSPVTYEDLTLKTAVARSVGVKEVVLPAGGSPLGNRLRKLAFDVRHSATDSAADRTKTAQQILTAAFGLQNMLEG